MNSFAVVMPAYNEEEGIDEFVREILQAFSGRSVTIQVVDDCSTDGTASVLRQLTVEGLPVTVETNSENLGHGLSTVRALRKGLESGADVIVAVDGDGQFRGDEIASLALRVDDAASMVIEGRRVGRTDPLYRQVVSWATRGLVASASGQWPRDANTPLRCYPRHVLADLVSQLPQSSVVPNLMISVLVRTGDVAVSECDVTALPRRGSSSVGTSWGGFARYLPSRRFVRFCRAAILDWRAFRKEHVMGK